MVLPILTYGNPTLREETAEVTEDSEEFQRLIDDMIETMHGANGIGLAGPQVGRHERLFVVDVSAMAETIEEELGKLPEWATGPQVFINPELADVEASDVVMEEGCLSIPEVQEDITRPDTVRVTFLDRSFEEREIVAEGILARVIQHEFDHLNGVLFIDRLSPLRRRMLRRRLQRMAAGEVEADYPLA